VSKSSAYMRSRLRALRAQIEAKKLDALLVTSLNNVRYLTGYSGSNGIAVVSRRGAHFLTDFRYKTQAQKEVKDYRIRIAARQLLPELKNLPPLRPGARVGFEAVNLSVKVLATLKKLLPQVKLVATEGLVESVSVRKDEEEIRKLRRAATIADAAFEHVLKFIKPGVRELDIASEIDYFMKKSGLRVPALESVPPFDSHAVMPSFETIVASGVRSAMPHGVASAKKIKKGEFVTMDFGGQYQGYSSDLTRTVVVGKATPKQKKIYNLVLEAQLAALSNAKGGMKAKDLDKVARDVISSAGYGKSFGHGLGHGLGLLVHDSPAVSPASEATLLPGMVITIEPGIYLQGWGGVRIEDDIVITAEGCRLLTKANKELVEL
jgi:Xaa-Pro aminopeptidase